jgi:hypothetical protein
VRQSFGCTVEPAQRRLRVESVQIPTYPGVLTGDRSTARRTAGAFALCFFVTLSIGIASAPAQNPNPDPAPVPAPDPAPVPQPPPAPAPPPAATPHVASTGSSPASAPKRKATKRKKLVKHQPPAVVYAAPLHTPDALGTRAAAARILLSEPGSPQLPAAWLAWLAISAGCSILLMSAVLFLTGYWEP